MKLHEIMEMTILSGDIEMNSHNGLAAVKTYIENNGTHTGDIDGFPIFVAYHNKEIFYGIKVNDEIVSFINFTKVVINGKNMLQLGTIFTLKEYRGKHFTHRILFFIKTHENISIIDYGSHSPSGIEALKSLSRTKRFLIVWYNIKTGEKEPYVNNTDQYGQSKYRKTNNQTDWRILIEDDNDNTIIPRYNISERWSFGFPYVIFWDGMFE